MMNITEKTRIAAEIMAFKNTNFSDCPELTHEQLAQMKPSHLRNRANSKPRYNAETEAAMQEAREIMSGKKKAKSYSSADELFAELDAEHEASPVNRRNGHR